MIPVDMGNKKMYIYIFFAGFKISAKRPDPSAGIYYYLFPATEIYLQAGGISSIDNGIFSWHGGRPPGTPKLDSHLFVLGHQEGRKIFRDFFYD